MTESNTSLTANNKQSKQNPIFLILLILLILAATAVIFFYLGKKEVNDQNTKLTKQVEELQAEQSQPTAFLLPEWDIEFEAGNGLSDLTYYIKKFNVGETAYFTTRSLMSAADAYLDFAAPGADICYPGAIGAISRGKADEPSSFDLTFGTDPNAVKAGDYYYTFTQPQASCSEGTSVINLQNQQISSLRDATKTIKPSE